MPKFEKDGYTHETSLPSEIQRLCAEGFQEVQAEKPKAPAKSDNK